MAHKSHIRSVRSFAVGLLLCSVVYCMLAQPAPHGKDTSICDPASIQNSATPKKPILPETYRLSVECNIRDKNYSTDYTEFFDFYNKRAAVHQWEEGFHAYGIYNYNTNELLTVVETQPPQCSVDALNSSSNNFLFGSKTSSTNTKIKPMYSAYGALRFGRRYKEQYIGRTTIRGMQVDEWKSCMYWDNIDATMEVHWYFSAPNWTMADGRSQVPVRCNVHGNVWEVKGTKRSPRAFSHTYELSEFLTGDMAGLTTQTFETPSGLVCPGRKDTKPLPTPHKAFQFTAEILTPAAKTIGYIRELYDQGANLMRYDYIPSKDTPSDFGYGLLTEVHDFSEGISYVMDPSIGNCTVQPIDGTGFDAKFVDGSNMRYVRIRTPAEFFYFDKTKYAYEGIKNVRGVDCDVYITTRTDWPPKTKGYNSTWEWYFARQEWQQSTGQNYDIGMPLMLILNAKGIGSYIYNMYEYDESDPLIWQFDTSRCYNYTERKDFSFKLPGDYKKTAAKNLQIFKYLTLLAVHKATGVSPLRITNINVDYDASNILVTLSLLGTTLITGDVPAPAKQVPLNVAVIKLTAAINNGSLIVPVDVDKLTDPIALVAKPNSLRQKTIKSVYYKPTAQKTTYETGAVVGLAMGMAVLFFCIGFGAVYMFYKRNGGSFVRSVKSEKPLENPAYENAP